MFCRAQQERFSVQGSMQGRIGEVYTVQVIQAQSELGTGSSVFCKCGFVHPKKMLPRPLNSNIVKGQVNSNTRL